MAEPYEPAPADLVHRVRPNIFSAEKEYRLEPQALTRSSGAAEVDRLPYREIARLRLETLPSGIGRQRRCVVGARAGSRWVLLSGHYAGLGRLEDRSESYEPFMRALVSRVRAANPGAVLERGHSRIMWFVWLILLMLSLHVVGALVFAAAFGGAPWSALPAAMFLVGVVPTTWRSVRTGRPTRFDPDADEIP
jgi:hypothetical protein